MKRPAVYYVLLFLVFSAFADDAWAAGTPDWSDDLLAAQDNLYLHVNPKVGWAGGFAKNWPALDHNLAGLSTLPLETNLESCSGRVPADSPGVRQIIYFLMTLRR